VNNSQNSETIEYEQPTNQAQDNEIHHQFETPLEPWRERIGEKLKGNVFPPIDNECRSQENGPNKKIARQPLGPRYWTIEHIPKNHLPESEYNEGEIEGKGYVPYESIQKSHKP